MKRFGARASVYSGVAIFIIAIVILSVALAASALGRTPSSAPATGVVDDQEARGLPEDLARSAPSAEGRETPVALATHGGLSEAQPPLASMTQPQDQGRVNASGGAFYKVGIQAGHWQTAQAPDELASLRGSTGAAGDGWREVDVNLDIARRVVERLSQAGVQAELLPVTVPVQYQADAFVSLHGDVSNDASVSGYKAARNTSSLIPETDDALLRAIKSAYAAATGLPEHPQTITRAMLRYYAFSTTRRQHVVAPTTPAVILEMGFLTNHADLSLLTQRPDAAAEGIAQGVLSFLGLET